MALLAYNTEIIIKIVEVLILIQEEHSLNLERILTIHIKATILEARKYLILKVLVQCLSKIWNRLQGQ